MTGEIKYNLDLMEELRLASTKAGARVGTVGDEVKAQHVAGSVFGKSPGASSLAQAVTSALGEISEQCAKGETLLRAVGRTIDGVMTAIEKADQAGKQNFAGGMDRTSAAGYSPTGGGGTGTVGGGGTGGGGGDSTSPSANPNAGTAPPVDPGHGVQINLPKGMGSVEAPNEKAAGAVRAALSQLGTPYVWAAENPGRGFDCSGLTQWAYGKEGIALEHDAAHQNVGQQVSQANLAPGDLVVWDGHVAMYIGKDQMVEAPHTGDVVHIVPLRTSNAGDRFEGFFRPSA
ncbi:MAG: C40 family peptidase [Jatrophihabitans sp.]